jgi:hypothetical protein
VKRTFDDLLTEAWSRLKPLRQVTIDEPLIGWWKLTEMTSTEEVLCGFSLQKKGFFGKKAIAEIQLAYDGRGDFYKISTWRKYHHPVVIYPSKDSSDRPNLDQAVSKIEDMLGVIRPLMTEEKIDKSFPPQWVGKRLW